MIDLSLFNPWWKSKAIPKNLLGKKRPIFNESLKYLDSRQILIFSGLRRVGKTTLMFQIMNELLNKKNINPYHILYFSFDEEIYEIKDILNEFEKEVIRESISSIKVYLFFDEIQKLENWPSKIKVIFDMYPNIKIFLTGSAAIILKKGTRESLAGRFFDFTIHPLDFDEYLDFVEVEIDKERENIYEAEIKKNFKKYLETGGFIEVLKFDEDQKKKYFKEGLLERVIYRDLPGVFNINYPDLLYKLVQICAERPGIYLDYKNIANDLKYNQRTIANYYSYLEHSMLIKKLYNYSTNFITSEKKMKRAYLASTAFTISLRMEENTSLLLEQFYVTLINSKFFFRSPQKYEVDIIFRTGGKIIPVEVKIKNKIKKEDISSVVKFLKLYKLNKGFIITKETEESYSREDLLVKLIPFWKYWTLKKELGF